MMWIAGVPPSHVFHAIIAATVAFFIFGAPAAIVQQKYSPLMRGSESIHRVDWTRVYVVAFILLLTIATNVFVNYNFPKKAEHFPFIGAAVWVAIMVGAFARRPNWKLLPRAFGGSIFLLALVMGAALMPVEHLPAASWETAFGLGFLSAVFDNIPLTALDAETGRLRSGHAGVHGRFWRIDGLVRFFLRRGLVQHVSRSAIGRAMAPTRVGNSAVVRGQLLHHACSLGLAAGNVVSQSESAVGKNRNCPPLAHASGTDVNVFLTPFACSLINAAADLADDWVSL